MPARLPDDVLYRIKVRLDCGESVAQIHDATKVPLSTLYRLCLNFQVDLFGQAYPPPTVVLGHKRLLLPAQELVIYDICWFRITANVVAAIAQVFRG